MADITLLTPEQLEARTQPTGRSGRQRRPERTRIIAAYKAAMQEARPGYGADVMLAPAEDKRHVRQDLHAAADELHLILACRPVKDQRRMHVRFITPEEHAAKPKRGRRPQAPSAQATGQPDDLAPPPAAWDTPPRRINPIQLQTYLKGTTYPADKRGLLAAADRNGAPADVRRLLERLPEETFSAPKAVSQAIGQLP